MGFLKMRAASEAPCWASQRGGTAAAAVSGGTPALRAARSTHRVAEGVRAATRAKRISGVDIARGLAVIGMLAVHVGPDALENVFAGRDLALFVFLSGVSIALLSGGVNAPRGGAARLAAVRIAVRGALLVPVGLALM